MVSIAGILFLLLALNASAVLAGDYEILHDIRNASGWFGGDDRPGFGPRNVGAGQSVVVDADILLEEFSFYITRRFDYDANPTNSGHAVTLTLDVRDATGGVLKTVTRNLTAAFNGGWVTWTGIDISVAAGTMLIFTSYVNGAYDSGLSSGQAGDGNAEYPNGVRFTKTGMSDADMGSWSRWDAHSWDSTFRLRGSSGVTGIPDLSRSTAVSAYTGPGSVVLLNRPDGAGSPFNASRSVTGVHDAGVTLTVRDFFLFPIANYPAEDLWLESLDGGLAFCNGGTIADRNTDTAGTTTWLDPLFAGGASQSPTIVLISGTALSGSDLPITHNSADISGDGIVNLADITSFAADFYGSYAFRSDLYYDGVVNLVDVVVLAEALGASCP